MEDREEKDYSLMMTLFSVAAGMVGVCLTGIGLVQVITAVRKTATMVDECLAVNAIVFLVCCFAGLMSFRESHPEQRERYRRLGRVSFFIGMVITTAICALMTVAFA